MTLPTADQAIDRSWFLPVSNDSTTPSIWRTPWVKSKRVIKKTRKSLL